VCVSVQTCDGKSAIQCLTRLGQVFFPKTGNLSHHALSEEELKSLEQGL